MGFCTSVLIPWDTHSQNQQSAEPQPDMPKDNQPAVHQTALPRDKQAGPELALPQNKEVGPSAGGTHASVRSAHTLTMQGDSNSQTRSSVNSTANGAGAKAPPQTHARAHQLSKRTVPVAPTFIPTQALTPRTTVLLDWSGPEREKRGLVSPATKPAGVQPKCKSSK